MPPKLVVLGAGASGVEIAQAYGCLGSQVTIVDVGLLPSLDPDVGEQMARVFQKEQLNFIAGLAIAFAFDGTQYQIATSNEDEPDINADSLLVVAGRMPHIDGLDLNEAGVAFDEKGIQVDKNLRTSARHVFAAGNCTGGFQSTHFASG